MCCGEPPMPPAENPLEPTQSNASTRPRDWYVHWPVALLKALPVLAASLLIAIVLINVANVMMRYVFGAAIGWAEEVMAFLMVAVVFLSFPAVTLDGNHIRMDLLVDRLCSPRSRRWLDKLSTILSVLVLGAVTLAEGEQRPYQAERRPAPATPRISQSPFPRLRSPLGCCWGPSH